MAESLPKLGETNKDRTKTTFGVVIRGDVSPWVVAKPNAKLASEPILVERLTGKLSLLRPLGPRRAEAVSVVAQCECLKSLAVKLKDET